MGGRLRVVVMTLGEQINNALNGVTVSANRLGGSGGFDFGGMPDWMRFQQLDWWNSDFSLYSSSFCLCTHQSLASTPNYSYCFTFAFTVINYD